MSIFASSRGSETEATTEEAYTSDEYCESTASSQFYYKGAADKQEYYHRLKLNAALAESRSLIGEGLFGYDDP